MKDRNDNDTHPKIKSHDGRKVVVYLYQSGFPMKRIAALFDENQGRVAEVIKEDKEDLE